MALARCPSRSRKRGENRFLKVLRRPAGGIARGEKNPARPQQRRCRAHQPAIVPRRAEHAGLLGLRKGRRVQQDQVETASFFVQAPKPVECVPEDEIVSGRIKLIEREIAPAPIQVLFRQVKAGDPGAGASGAVV